MFADYTSARGNHLHKINPSQDLSWYDDKRRFELYRLWILGKWSQVLVIEFLTYTGFDL